MEKFENEDIFTEDFDIFDHTIEELGDLELYQSEELDDELNYDEVEYTDDLLFDDEDDVINKIQKISNILSEEIVIDNIMRQIDNRTSIGSYKQNYINLFISKYSDIWRSLDLLSGDDKTVINDITERLILRVLDELTKLYGISIGRDLDSQIFLDESLVDISTLYEFFVLRNVSNIVDLFVSQLDDNSLIQEFVDMLKMEKYINDPIIKEDLKRGLDPRIVAVESLSKEIVDRLITENSDSLFALINRIIKLDLYEEINQNMYDIVNDFGDRFQIVIHDTDAAELYFQVLYSAEVKSYVQNELINKYRKKILNN